MPVLVNKQTGLAENLTLQQEQEALSSGSHEVPLYGADNEPITAPHSEVNNLLQQGFRLPNSEEYNKALDYAKYSTTGQQLLTGAESAASALTLGASKGLEQLLGADAEDIRKREEINPIASTVGMGVGILGGLLTGTGAPALASKLGATAASGIQGAGALAKVGSTAAQLAVENAILASGDEVGKMLVQDPHQTVGSAAASVGLAGLIGGAFGVAGSGANELWKLGPGKKIETVLNNLKKTAEGVPSDLAAAAQLDIPPELLGALGESPQAQRAFQKLMQADTKAGVRMQEVHADFQKAASKAVEETAGIPADVDAFALGEKFKSNLVNNIKEIGEPISKQFDDISKQFGKIDLDLQTRARIGDELTKIGDAEGYFKMPDSKGNKLIQKVSSDLKLQKTPEDLRKYASNLQRENPFGSEGYYAAKQIGGLLDNAVEASVEKSVARQAPELLETFAATKQEYRQMKDLFGELNDRLKTGKQFGLKSFSKNIEEMDAETILKRLSPKGDVAFQQLLETKFPSIAQEIKQVELNKLLNASKIGQDVNLKKLFKNIDKISETNKQYVDFLLAPEQQARLKAISELLEKVPKNMNPSGTAKTLAGKFSDAVPGIGGVIGSMVGGPLGSALGFAIAPLVKGLPDQGRLAFLKFLGSSANTDAVAFKQMAEYIAHVQKGQKQVEKGIESIFSGGSKVIPRPIPERLLKLEKMVDAASADPSKLEDSSGGLAPYLPQQSVAIAESSARVVSYLSSIKPAKIYTGPLNEPLEPNQQQKAAYKDALTIAENPAVILNKVHDGTLNSKEIQHLQAMYPDYYQALYNKFNDKIVEWKSKKKNIPYKTRLSLSVFMQQPLDSTVQPVSLQNIQNTFVKQQQQPNQSPTGSGTRLQKLGKMPSSYATPLQRREMKTNAQ